jgi:hypothetical protein
MSKSSLVRRTRIEPIAPPALVLLQFEHGCEPMNRVSVCNADVDDLVKGRGAEYIDASSLVLVFASSGYFESAN